VDGIQNTPLLQKIDENDVCLPKRHESNICFYFYFFLKAACPDTILFCYLVNLKPKYTLAQIHQIKHFCHTNEYI